MFTNKRHCGPSISAHKRVCIRRVSSPLQVLDTLQLLLSGDPAYCRRVVGALPSNAVVPPPSHKRIPDTQTILCGRSSNAQATITAEEDFQQVHVLHYAAEHALAQGRCDQAEKLFSKLCRGTSTDTQVDGISTTLLQDAAGCPSDNPRTRLSILVLRRYAFVLMRSVHYMHCCHLFSREQLVAMVCQCKQVC